MTIKLVWKVAPEPVGRYRSFEERGWPTADYKGTDKPAVMLQGSVGYTPRLARDGGTALILTVFIADWRRLSPGAAAFTWRKLKATFTSLQEAKEAAAQAISRHPEFIPAAVCNASTTSQQ